MRLAPANAILSPFEAGSLAICSARAALAAALAAGLAQGCFLISSKARRAMACLASFAVVNPRSLLRTMPFMLTEQKNLPWTDHSVNCGLNRRFWHSVLKMAVWVNNLSRPSVPLIRRLLLFLFLLPSRPFEFRVEARLLPRSRLFDRAPARSIGVAASENSEGLLIVV